MAEERIDIVINDKVSPNTAKKIEDIAKSADHAQLATDKLIKSQLGLQQAAARTVTAETQLATATQRLAKETSNAEAAANKAGISTQRLVQAHHATATSASRSASATQTLARSQLATAAAAQRLVQAQYGTVASSARASTAAANLAKANTNAATAAVRHNTANTTLQRGLQGVTIGAQRVQQANQRTTQSHLATATAAIRHQQALIRLQQAQNRIGGGAGAGGAGGGAIAGIAGGLSAGYIIGIADEYLRYEQRIRSVTDTEAEYARVKVKLLEISNQTFAALDTTALLYQRFAPSLERLKASEEELFTVITNLNKAMALSGATTQEADGALRQLGQAFGADALRGQELNSVLEQIPLVARVIATEIGIDTAQLRAFANSGQVTSDQMLKAFLDTGKGVEELQARFARFEPTITSVSTVFRNNFVAATGELFKTTGAVAALTGSILFLSDHMEIVAGVGAFLFPLLVAGFVTSNAAAALFNATLLTNPLILGAAVFAGAIAALGVLNTKVEGGIKIWNDMKDAIDNTIIGLLAFITEMLSGIDRLINGWRAVKEAITGVVQEQSNIAGPLGDYVIKLLEAKASGKSIVDEVLPEWAKGQARITDEIGKSGAAYDHLTASYDEHIQHLRETGVLAWNTMSEEARQAREETQRNTKAVKELEVAYDSLTRSLLAMRAARAAGEGRSTSTYSAGAYGNTFTVRRAAGGPVYGPGGPRDDKVPAMLSNGEYVVNAEATSRHRQLLEAINSSPIRMATGGFIQAGTNRYNMSPAMAHIQGGYSGTYSPYGADGGAKAASGFDIALGYRGRTPFEHIFYDPHTMSAEVKASLAEQFQQAAMRRAELQTWMNSLSSDVFVEARHKAELNELTRVLSKEIGEDIVDPRKYVPRVGRLTYDSRNSIFSALGGNEPILNPYFGKEIEKYETTQGSLGRVGYLTSLIARTPVWGATAGQYVQYNGPSYGGSVSYGGDPNLPGFQHGGSFEVGGSGGPDSQLVQFMATPKEQVTVTKPGQGGSGWSGPLVGTVNLYANDLNSYKGSEEQMMANLARHVADAARKNGITMP